jgi:hypothetical protein
MIQESMKRMSMRVPEAERANFKRDISDKLMGSGQIEKKTIEAAARVFSKAELEALSKFYASPEGRSSMEKMPGFMAQLSRIVQMELMGLMEKAKAEQQKKAEAEKAKQEKDAPKTRTRIPRRTSRASLTQIKRAGLEHDDSGPARFFIWLAAMPPGFFTVFSPPGRSGRNCMVNMARPWVLERRSVE